MTSQFVADVLREHNLDQCQAVEWEDYVVRQCPRRAKFGVYCEAHAPSSAVDPDGEHRGEIREPE